MSRRDSTSGGTRAYTSDEPWLLSVADVARLLNISKGALQKLRRQARVPAPVEMGRRVLWRREELEAWVRTGCPTREAWESRRRQRR